MEKENNIYKNNKPKIKIKKNSKSAGSPVSAENFKVPLDIPATPFRSCPETCEEIINTYGTYNIQPTANTENDFPAIAQGTPEYMAERSREFFRGEEDSNPASDTSDKHCL